MKQRGDDYGSTLSLLNVQNGHLLLPLTCVLSILDLRILTVNVRLLLETSERHTATDLVNFVYYPTGFL